MIIAKESTKLWHFKYELVGIFHAETTLFRVTWSLWDFGGIHKPRGQLRGRKGGYENDHFIT